MNYFRNRPEKRCVKTVRSVENSPSSILKGPKNTPSKERRRVHFSVHEEGSESLEFQKSSQTPLSKGRPEVRNQFFGSSFIQTKVETPKHRRSKSGVESIEECKILSREVSFENPKHLSISSLIKSINKRKELLAQSSYKPTRKDRKIKSDFAENGLIVNLNNKPCFSSDKNDSILVSKAANSSRRATHSCKKPPAHRRKSVNKKTKH